MEVIEQDTADSEDINNLLEYLLPSGFHSGSYALFGFSYNKRVLDGWVKQPSACCGAAAVAGAWNSLFGYHRRDADALSHVQVLEVYKTIMREMIAKKQSAFERKLGAPILSLLDDVVIELHIVGREIGGKKGFGPTKPILRKIINKLCIQHHSKLRAMRAAGDFKDNSGDDMNVSALDCLVVLLEKDGFLFEEVEAEVQAEAKTEEGKESDEENESDEEELVSTVPIKSSSAGGKSGKWEWRKDFAALIQNMSGLVKLSAGRPSTAAIGNWGILEVANRLSEGHGLGCQVTARLFMGKKKTAKSKIDFALSRKDAEVDIFSQWSAIRSSLMRPNEALVFHLKNHYALIFACREWVDERTGERVRQILTARKGQRPVAWMDFAEAREVMLGWDGYKIIALSASIGTEELRKSVVRMDFGL